jgi:hypothetical protein
MISSDRLSQALKYLSETDEKAANLKAEVARKEYICKKTRARVFLISSGNNEVRKAEAEVSEDTDKSEKEKVDAIVEFEKTKAKRETEALIVEVWRSVNANRRVGNI